MRLLGLFLLFAMTTGVPAVVIAQVEVAGSFIIRDVRVFDGERVQEHRTVVVSAGSIAEIGHADMATPELPEVDGTGRTLLPGLIDAHVHLPDDARAALSQSAAFGVTTVLDMFTSDAALQAIQSIERGENSYLADVLVSSIGATAPGGHPSQMSPDRPFPTIVSAEEAEVFVDARIREGADYIKIIYDDRFGRPGISSEALRALIVAAQSREKVAVVHIGTEEQAREAILAGADGLAHLFTGESLTDGFLDIVSEHAVFVIPTLTPLAIVCGDSIGTTLDADDRLGPFLAPQWRDWLRTSMPAISSCAAPREAIPKLVDREVPVLAGTDAVYGISLHGELRLLVDYGLSPPQALASATSVPARIFGLEDRGAIAPGRIADLVLVNGDPTADIEATGDIVSVWKRGVPVPRQTYPRAE